MLAICALCSCSEPPKVKTGRAITGSSKTALNSEGIAVTDAQFEALHQVKQKNLQIILVKNLPSGILIHLKVATKEAFLHQWNEFILTPDGTFCKFIDTERDNLGNPALKKL